MAERRLFEGDGHEMVEIFAGRLSEVRGSTTTGVALSTTAAFTAIPVGTSQLFLTARNFSTAVVAKLAINPRLVVLKTQDALATAPTDYSDAAQDGSTSTDVVLSSQGTAAQSDFLYVGAHRPFRGVSIDVDAANGNASTLTVKYWTGSAWSDITATDGTISTGASIGQDGTVTWTVPSDWTAAKLYSTGDTTIGFPGAGNILFWTRWEFSAALDSSTTLNSMMPMAASTNFFELSAAAPTLELKVENGMHGHSCIEALTDAGTANLICGFATSQGGRY